MPNIVFCDGFDHYDAADIAKKWSAAGFSITMQAGRFAAGQSVRIGSSGQTISRGVAAVNQLYVECAMKAAAYNDSVWMAMLSDGSIQTDIRPVAGGEITVTRNGTVLAATSGLGLLTNTWYHIGLQVKIGTTDGAYDVRLNGVTVLSATNVNTKAQPAATIDAFRLQAMSSAAYDFDDCVVSTDGFCGDCRVQALYPQGAGNYSQWAPSAGLGYQCVDETLMNSDTDYVSSSAAGQRNSYDFQSLGAGVIKAVQHVVAVRKDDAGSRTIKQFARIGGTDYDGPAAAVTDSYVMQRRVMVTSPSTGAAWTTSQVDAAEFGSLLES